VKGKNGSEKKAKKKKIMEQRFGIGI